MHVWQGGWYCRWHGDPSRNAVARRNHGQYWWTDERLEQLYRLLEQGESFDRIGERIGCTAHAAWEARKRYHIPSRARLTLSSRDVAFLLGKSCSKSVVRWIERGWLRARRGYQQGARQIWIVKWADLEAFVADPAHWQCWDLGRVTNYALIAVSGRPAFRFLTHAEVAAICCVERQTVNTWIRKGWLKAQRNGNWMVREDWLAAFRERWDYGQRGAFAGVAA